MLNPLVCLIMEKFNEKEKKLWRSLSLYSSTWVLCTHMVFTMSNMAIFPAFTLLKVIIKSPYIIINNIQLLHSMKIFTRFHDQKAIIINMVNVAKYSTLLRFLEFWIAKWTIDWDLISLNTFKKLINLYMWCWNLSHAKVVALISIGWNQNKVTEKS